MTEPSDHDTNPTEEHDATDSAEVSSSERTRHRRRGGRGQQGGRGRTAGPPEGDGAAGDGASTPSADVPSADTPSADVPSSDVPSADATAGTPAEAPSAAAPGEGASEEGTQEGGGSGRRRRRGRRGRGRGRGAGAREPERDQGADEGPSDTEGLSDTDGPADTEDRAEPKEAATRGRTRTRTGAGEDRAAEPASGDGSAEAPAGEDREVAAAMARGGTRMAAKRGRRGNGGGRSRSGQQRPGGVAEEVRRAILEGPPRTMLVTNRGDRTQIAVLEDRTVVEHYVTRKKDVTFVGNIYMARVQNVLPGMEAAFLDIGKGRNGVLYAGEVLYDELDLEESADQRIENVLKPGQKILVQVTKDPMGSKGPRLTMHLSLAGRYMVLAPNSDLFGISRKLTDRERDRLRRTVKKVKPEEHGVIVRTAAENASEEQLLADLERLLARWSKVEELAADAKALTAVYEEPPLVVKVIRDNFGPEFERCIVDDEDLYHQVRGYLDEVAPELSGKVELYGQPTADARARAAGAPSVDEAAADTATADGAAVERATAGDEEATPVPAAVDLAAAATRREQLPALFDAYDVTDQLRKALNRKVWLPSGGYLIIEQTEAMKVIDVNTGKFTGGSDSNLEEVVLKTNLEAADEIVRQLRLRDIGGIIIIDFIDMLLKANQDQVVRRLKRELLRDRTKTRVSEVSKLGLVQMTRKNVSQGLLEAFSHSCDACDGRGVISQLD